MRNQHVHTPETFEAFQNGKEKGFTTLFTAYYPALCFFACRYVKDTDAAEDIAQECFIKLWQRHSSFASFPQIRAYLYKIARFACIDYLKQLAKKNEFEAAEEAEEPVLHHLIRTETWRQICELVNGLPPGVSRVMKMLYIEGKSIREIAAELQKSVHTIKSHRAKGISLLRSRHTGFLFSLLLLLAGTILQPHSSCAPIFTVH